MLVAEDPDMIQDKIHVAVNDVCHCRIQNAVHPHSPDFTLMTLQAIFSPSQGTLYMVDNQIPFDWIKIDDVLL